MQTQPIPGEGLPNGAANGASRPSSGDAFVDRALSALDEGLSPDNDNVAPAPGKRRPAREPAAEPEGPGAEESDEDEEQALPGATEDDETEEGAEDGAEDEDAHDTRGSKENPFTVKDLPKNLHVQVKVDGEKVTVPLHEALDGYIGQRTINARLNKAKQLTEEATQFIERGKAEREQVRGAVRELLADPDQLYEYFLATGDREQVLERVALKYAEQLRKFRSNPQERLDFERRRDQMRLQAEREHLQAQRDAEIAERQRKEMQERAQQVFIPGWNEGLKKAGFPKPTPALYEEVMVRANQRAQSGHEVTSDDIAEFTYRACKLLELPPKGQKPKPAPLAPPKEKLQTNGKRRGDPWADKPRHERVKDPDYFLRKLKRSDYR